MAELCPCMITGIDDCVVGVSAFNGKYSEDGIISIEDSLGA